MREKKRIENKKQLEKVSHTKHSYTVTDVIVKISQICWNQIILIKIMKTVQSYPKSIQTKGKKNVFQARRNERLISRTKLKKKK